MTAEEYNAICADQNLRRELARASIPFFRKYYLGRDTPLHMIEWADDVQDLWNARHMPIRTAPHYLWRLAPKDHAKTTFHIQDCPLWFITTQDPNLRVVLATVTPNLGVDSLGSVERQLATNPRLIEDWGPFVPPIQRAGKLKWSETKLTILTRTSFDDKNPTFSVYGTNDEVQGSRGDIILCDDIISLRNTRQATQRKKISQWFFSDLLGLLSPTSIVIGIGTKKHPMDLHAEIEAKNGTDGWIFKLQRAIVDRDKKIVLWPEYRNWEWLMAKESMNATEFARDYQNLITADIDRKFKSWDYWSGRPDDLPRPLHIYTFCDAAFSQKEGADRTAFVTVGVGPDGRWNILSAEARRMNPSEVLEEFFNQHQRWARFADRYTQGWEPYLLENILGHFLRVEQRRRKITLPILVVKRKSGYIGKKDHINALEPHFNHGKDSTVRLAPGLTQLESELAEWVGEDTGGYCDILDALADGVEMIRPPSIMDAKPGPGTFGHLLNAERKRIGLPPRRFAPISRSLG